METYCTLNAFTAIAFGLRLVGRIVNIDLIAVHLDYYAATAAPDAEKLTMVCFSCESTSSAIVITSASSRLKSTVLKLVCNVLKMLTCRMRDSSIIIGME